MYYGRYKNVRNAAWQALIDFNVRALPVMVTDIASKASIRILDNSDVCILSDSQLGMSVLDNRQWYIIYDDTQAEPRARFTIAHELGHIFLGHTMVNGRWAYDPAAEQAADMFALRLLAPACVLWGLGLRTPEEIASACNISIASARIRAGRMAELYKRNKFLTHKLEQQLYKQFEEYIKWH